MKICQIEGCPDPVESRGWCNKHYLRWWKYGDPLYRVKPYPKRRPDNNGALCSVIDWAGPCLNLAKSRGYCTKHYARWRNHGDPLFAAIRRRPYRQPLSVCEEPGCEEPIVHNGLCQHHYHRQYYYDGGTGFELCPVCGEHQFRVSMGYGICHYCRKEQAKVGKSKDVWTSQVCWQHGFQWLDETGGVPPSMNEWEGRFGNAALNCVVTHFGSWRNFLAAFGCEPRPTGRAVGEAHNAKLTWERVEEIRTEPLILPHEWAKLFAVSKETIKQALRNQTWVDPSYEYKPRPPGQPKGMTTQAAIVGKRF